MFLRIVVERIIQREFRDVLAGVRVIEVRYEGHFVGQTVQIEQHALDRGMDFPKRQTGSHPRLAIEPRDVVLFVQALSPVTGFPQSIRNHAHGTHLKWQIDLLSRDEPAPFRLHGRLFPRQIAPAVEIFRIRGRVQHIEPCVAGVRMRVPSEVVIQEGSPHQKMVATRPPVGLRYVGVEVILAANAQRLVIPSACEIEHREVISPLVPFLFEVLFEEVAIGDPTQLGRNLPAVLQVLTVAPIRSPAILRVRYDVQTIAAQVVRATIVNSPRIEPTVHRPGMAQETVALVIERRANPESPLAQVIRAQEPVGSLRRVLHVEQLIDIPVSEYLSAEHVVVANRESLKVVRRFTQIGGHHRPIEDRQSAHIQEVVATGCQQLMIDRDLLGPRIHVGHAGHRVDARQLRVSETNSLRLEPVLGHPHLTRGDRRPVGLEMLPVHLLQHVGLEPHHTLVVGHGCEHFSRQDHAIFVGRVVVHAIGVDQSIALAEDNIAFHVDFDGYFRSAGDFRTGRRQRLQVRPPQDEPIGFDDDPAEVSHLWRFDALNERTQPVAEYGHRLIGHVSGKTLDVDRRIAPRPDLHPFLAHRDGGQRPGRQ